MAREVPAANFDRRHDRAGSVTIWKSYWQRNTDSVSGLSAQSKWSKRLWKTAHARFALSDHSFTTRRRWSGSARLASPPSTRPTKQTATLSQLSAHTV